MVYVFLPDIFYAKVIHYEAKKDRLPLVAPQARSCWALKVPRFIKSPKKLCVGGDSSLWLAINALGDFKGSPAVLGELVQVVFVNKFLKYVVNIDADVLRPVHGSSETRARAG